MRLNNYTDTVWNVWNVLNTTSHVSTNVYLQFGMYLHISMKLRGKLLSHHEMESGVS